MDKFRSYRSEIVRTCRLLLRRGYLKATEGNISVRVRGGDYFAITPSNFDYRKMQAPDICVLDSNARAIDAIRKPSIESGMHAGVYQTRADVHAIIHTHQPYASVLALIDQPIPALYDEQVRFLGRSVEIVQYRPSGTAGLKRAVQLKVRRGDNAFILQNHGVLILGGTMEQAIHNMFLLEKCALTYLLALLSGRPITRIPRRYREMMFAILRADERRFASL